MNDYSTRDLKPMKLINNISFIGITKVFDNILKNAFIVIL